MIENKKEEKTSGLVAKDVSVTLTHIEGYTTTTYTKFYPDDCVTVFISEPRKTEKSKTKINKTAEVNKFLKSRKNNSANT
jgi:hypothetical protein